MNTSKKRIVLILVALTVLSVMFVGATIHEAVKNTGNDTLAYVAMASLFIVIICWVVVFMSSYLKKTSGASPQTATTPPEKPQQSPAVKRFKDTVLSGIVVLMYSSYLFFSGRYQDNIINTLMLLMPVGWAVLVWRRYQSIRGQVIFSAAGEQLPLPFIFTQSIILLVSAIAWLLAIVFGSGMYPPPEGDQLGYFVGLMIGFPIVGFGTFILHKVFIGRRLQRMTTYRQALSIAAISLGSALVLYLLLSWIRG